MCVATAEGYSYYPTTIRHLAATTTTRGYAIAKPGMVNRWLITCSITLQMRGEEHTTQSPPSEQRSDSVPGGTASAPPTPLDIQLQDMDINKQITKSFGRDGTSFIGSTMPASKSVPSGMLPWYVLVTYCPSYI